MFSGVPRISYTFPAPDPFVGAMRILHAAVIAGSYQVSTVAVSITVMRSFSVFSVPPNVRKLH